MCQSSTCLFFHRCHRVPVFWRCGSHGKYGKDLAMSVMRRAQSICSKFNSNIKVETKAGSGDAKEVICATVKKLEADMLVIGSHNYGFLKRTLVGSVSNYCSKHVKCPTVVVKQPKNEKLVEI
uniref:UspA domain-containing protein n=1 Tax=Daucus carota subsp. sativus TaxID=79200 RepID=A0A169WQC6_DAUCS